MIRTPRKLTTAITSALLLSLLLVSQVLAAWKWGFQSDVAVAFDENFTCQNGMLIVANPDTLGFPVEPTDRYIDRYVKVIEYNPVATNQATVFNRELRIPRQATPILIQGGSSGDSLTVYYAFYQIFWNRLIQPGAELSISGGDMTLEGRYYFDYEAQHQKDQEHTNVGIIKPVVQNCWLVERGDYLREIADLLYGDRACWWDVYELNKEQLRHPNLIYPGQILELPEEADLQCPSDKHPGPWPWPKPRPWHPPWGWKW